MLKPKNLELSDTNYQTDSFVSTDDLRHKLKSYLKNQHFDAVIHLAAVGDFSVNCIIVGNEKIKPPDSKLKTTDKLTVELRKNPKLIDELKSFSKNPNVLVVGFKLSCNVLEKPTPDHRVDIWVSNRYEDVNGFLHKAEICSSSKTKKVNDKKELSCVLMDMIGELL